MQKAAFLIGFAAVLLIPGVAAESIAFRSPAQFGGSTELHEVQWALFFLDRPQTLEGSVALPGGAAVTNVSMTGPAFDAGPWASDDEAAPHQSSWEIPPGSLAVRFHDADVAALYLEADSIGISMGNSSADLRAFPHGACTEYLMTEEEVGWRASEDVCRDEGVSGLRFESANGTPVTVDVAGLHAVQIHNADVTCTGIEACPDGGFRRETRFDVAPGYSASVLELSRVQLTPKGDAGAAFAGSVKTVILGSRSLDLRLDGWLRLPLASADAGCQACVAATNQTLWGTGNFTFSKLNVDGDGFVGQFSGKFESARFDEATIDPSLLNGAAGVVAVAAAAGLVLLLKVLFGALFTRLGRNKALEHPNRRRLAEAIAKDPGINFLALVRASGVAVGTARHHLTVLVRAGLVAEQGDGKVRRFFPGARASVDWERQVLLREPDLRDLHGWLAGNPGATQLEVVAAMAPAGWSRSTAQHRLGRLVAAGLVHVRWQGRLKRHWVDGAQPASAPAAHSGLAAAPSAQA